MGQGVCTDNFYGPLHENVRKLRGPFAVVCENTSQRRRHCDWTELQKYGFPPVARETGFLVPNELLRRESFGPSRWSD